MAVQGTQTEKFYARYPFLDKRGCDKELLQKDTKIFADNLKTYAGDTAKLPKTEGSIMELGKILAETGTREQKKAFSKEIRPLILNKFKEIKTPEQAKELQKYVDAFCEKNEKAAFRKFRSNLNEVQKQADIASRAHLEKFRNSAVKKGNQAQNKVNQFKETFMERFSNNDIKTLEGAKTTSELAKDVKLVYEPKKYDYKALSEAQISKPVTPTTARTTAADLQAAFGGQVEHVEQISSYTRAGDLQTAFGGQVEQVKQISSYTDAVKKAEESAKALKEAQKAAEQAEAGKKVQDILEGLRKQREAAQTTTPVQELARQVAKPSIPERLIPPVEPKGYVEGFAEGIQKGKKVVNNNTTNNFYNTFMTEINQNVSSTINEELNTFTTNINKSQNQFIKNIKKEQTTFFNNLDKRFTTMQNEQRIFIAGIDGKIQQIADGQNQFLQEGRQILTDGKQVVDEGRKVVNEGRKVVNEGRKVVNEGKKVVDEGKKVFEEGRKIFEEGKKVVDEGKKVVDGGNKLLNEGNKLLNEGKKVVADGQNMIGEGQKLFGEMKQALEAGQKAQQNLSKLKWAAIGGAAVLGAIALFKACSGDDNKKSNQTVGDTDPIITPPVVEDDTTKAEGKDSTEYVVYPIRDMLETPKLEVPKVEIPDVGEFYPEEIADGDDILNGNLKGKKIYIAKKGDCIWNIAKKILAKSPKLKEEIKAGLKNKTEDAIIQILTMKICKINKINYYADPQTLPKIGDEVAIPKKYLEEIKEALKDKSLNEVLDEAA